MELTLEDPPENLAELLAWSWHKSGASKLVAEERRSENCSLIAYNTLTHFGETVERLPTAMLVGNRSAIAQMQLGSPVNDWPPIAYTIGRHPADDGRAHWVVFTPTHFVDLSFDQFDRPERGMLIDSPVAMPFTNMQETRDFADRVCYETGWDDGVWLCSTIWPLDDFTPAPFTPWDSIDEATDRLIKYMTKFG